MSHDRICTSTVSVVRTNGNIIPIGAPILCAPMMPRDLVLGRACLSRVKVVLQHVLECADLHTSVLGYGLVI